MPILPENKSKYPKNWDEISRNIRFERANSKCEFCGAVNYSYVNRLTREICTSGEDNAIEIILTVAHLDHNPENCNEDNLKALCQRCHNRYDIPHRKKTRKKRYLKNQLSINFA
jgi:5-methylcytosine-specific restriction endonuclease McrA